MATIQGTICSTSSNTLKSHTNTHNIRGIATLKDVERFRKGHLTRYRESIVAFIVKCIANLYIVNNNLPKLPILSKAKTILTNYTGSKTTKDSKNECNRCIVDDKMEITSTLSEGHYNKLLISVNSKPYDSQSGAPLSKMIASSLFMLSIFLLLLFLSQCNVSCFTVYVFVSLILTELGHKSVNFFDDYNQNVFSSLFVDCDILDKTNTLSVNASLCIDAKIRIKVTSDTRSRYSRFVYYNYRYIRHSHRNREPSRIPTRILSRLKTKNRKLRWIIYHQIRRNIPKSSKLHYYLNRFKVVNKHFVSKFEAISTFAFCVYQARKLNHVYKLEYSRYMSLFTCNRTISLYKSKSHVTSYWVFLMKQL